MQLLTYGRSVLACMLALLLACAGVVGTPVFGFADPTDKAQEAVDKAEASVAHAQATLDNAEARLSAINAEYDQLESKIDDLQKRIDKTARQAMKAQKAMLKGRQALSDTATSEYRDGSTANLLMLVFNSESFDELLRNIEYVSTIMSFQADEIAAQKERKARFDEVSNELNDQKNEQEKFLAEQDKKRQEAQEVVETAAAQLSSAQSEHSERLAELEAQVKALEEAKEKKKQEAAISDKADTINREDAVDPGESVQDNPDKEAPGSASKPNQGSSEDSVAEEKPSSDEGWKTGVASAYGGKTDPSTPNPGHTATGEVCDDSSMGVAVPMAWSGYRSLFGRTVEISYGGMTVYATVNDCGGLGGGSRSLDLQPGVWKAFGFSSCQAWGLRTVSYRFL